MIYSSAQIRAPFGQSRGRLPVLIVGQQPDAMNWIKTHPGPERFLLWQTDSPQKAVEKTQLLTPRLVMLAAALPKSDGMTVCKALKRHPLTEGTPVIIVGPADDGDAAAAALEGGADDYLSMPLQPTIAIAKLRALLRRTDESAEKPARVLRVHNLVIDGDRNRVELDGRPINDLPPIPFRLLFALASQLGRLFSLDELAETLAYSPLENNEYKLRFHMAKLRTLLGPGGNYIDTVLHRGYRMQSDMQRATSQPAKPPS